VFGAFALVYFVYPIVLRRRLNQVLGWIHFGVSLFALFLEFALTSWFNLRFHKQPGEPGFSAFMRAFGTSMDAFFWALMVFFLAQLIFVFNFFWSIFKNERPGQQAVVTAS